MPDTDSEDFRTDLKNGPSLSDAVMQFARRHLTEIILILAIIAVFGLTAMVNDAYTVKFGHNASQIIRQASMLGIFAIGASIVIIAGGIDLSSGAMVAFGGMIFCMTLSVIGSIISPDAADPTANLPLWAIVVAIMATLMSGGLIGTLHTWLITVIGLPPFVATLASLVGLRSLALIITQAVTGWLGSSSAKINIQDETFAYMGKEWWIPAVVFFIVATLAWILMNKTVVGRHLYAMGGNEEAARLSGIRTERLKWLAYTIGAVTAAAAGILDSAMAGVASPENQGNAYELFAIAAAVVGGCSLQGGVGKISGVVLAALFLRLVIDSVAQVIGSGSKDYEGLIVGLLVVLAVAFNELSSQRRGYQKQFFPGVLGWVAIPTISGIIGASMLTPKGGWVTGLVIGCAAFFVFTTLKLSAYLLAKKQTAATPKTLGRDD